MTLRSLLLLSTVCLASTGYSRPDSTDTSTESTVSIVASDAVVFIPASVLFLMNHELGHYTFASLWGAENARFGLIRKRPDGGHQLGWTEWQGDLGGVGNSCAFLGGVIFSRGLAEGSDLLARSVPLPNMIQRFFSITYLLGRFDLARYVLTDGLVNLGGGQGSDIDHFVTQMAGAEGAGRVLTYAVLAGIAVVDLVLDWDRVTMHWGVVTGTPYGSTHDGSHARIGVAPIIVGDAPGLHISVTW
jgi:hypothetical protein